LLREDKFIGRGSKWSNKEKLVANVKLGGKFLFILLLFFSYFYSPYNLKFDSKVHFIYILVLVSERGERESPGSG
jgi:hypothetical protein